MGDTALNFNVALHPNPTACRAVLYSRQSCRAPGGIPTTDALLQSQMHYPLCCPALMISDVSENELELKTNNGLENERKLLVFFRQLYIIWWQVRLWGFLEEWSLTGRKDLVQSRAMPISCSDQKTWPPHWQIMCKQGSSEWSDSKNNMATWILSLLTLVTFN